MPPGKQNPSPSAQEIAETLYRETMADCRDVWSMSDETLKRIHGRMASAITAAVAAAEREDTKMLDWLENPLNQLHMFGNFLQGGSPTELRNQIRLAMNSSASSSVLPAMETFCKRFGPMTINVGYGRDIEIYKRTQEKLFLAWCAGKESVLPATKATEERGDFWKRMFERAKCGCIQADCRQHGSWTPADIERIEFDPSVSPGNENQSAEKVKETHTCGNCGRVETTFYPPAPPLSTTPSVGRIQERVKLLEQLNIDACEDDTAVRNIVRPILGDHATDGDSYGVPGIVDLVEELIKSLLSRAETAEKLAEERYFDFEGRKASEEAAVALANELLVRVETAEAALRKVIAYSDDIRCCQGSADIARTALVLNETAKTWRLRSHSGDKKWTAYKTTFQLYPAPSVPDATAGVSPGNENQSAEKVKEKPTFIGMLLRGELGLPKPRLPKEVPAPGNENQSADQVKENHIHELELDNGFRCKCGYSLNDSPSPAPPTEEPKWSKVTPTESGLWWWWNEDEDNSPIPIEIAYSGTSGTWFAMSGQYGWNRSQEVTEMGGQWMPVQVPSVPDATAANKTDLGKPEPSKAGVVETQKALLVAAAQMDWQQVILNGGPPCFHLCEDGCFCGRAQSWPGHEESDDETLHAFISFERLLSENPTAANSSPGKPKSVPGSLGNENQIPEWIKRGDSQAFMDHAPAPPTEDCKRCNGSGRVDQFLSGKVTCGDCNGTGKVPPPTEDE